MIMNMMISKLTSDTFILMWNVSCVTSFLLPFMSFVIGRLTSDQYWNENDNNNDNNENYYENDYNNPNYYDEYGNYQGPTHWWQFWKKSYNNNGQEEENNNDNNDERRSPWWYLWGEEREVEPEEEGKGALLFLYIWTLVAFVGLAYIGNTTNMTVSTNLEVLRWILVGFANYCFVIIVLLIALEGVETEGREMENTGFYGQTAVVLMLTCIFALVQSIVFVSWSTKRINHLKTLDSTEKSDEYVAVEYGNSQPAPPGYKITM